MQERFGVTVTKDYLVFSAAHFITFDGDVCERLHGHNYKVRVDCGGPLDENHYVTDFIALRDQLRAIVETLDHRMLLPDRHPLIRVSEENGEVTAQFRERRWVFPREDCAILPMANTTTELLAQYIGRELRTRLSASGGHHLNRLVVAVDENEGQWGSWTWEAD